MSELAARHLHRSGATNISVTNRTYERAAANWPSCFKGTIVPLPISSSRRCRRWDIVITSSGAPHYILNKSDMRRVIDARKQRPMFLIDIAVPRNIEPAVNDLGNIFLYDHRRPAARGGKPIAKAAPRWRSRPRRSSPKRWTGC